MSTHCHHHLTMRIISVQTSFYTWWETHKAIDLIGTLHDIAKRIFFYFLPFYSCNFLPFDILVEVCQVVLYYYLYILKSSISFLLQLTTHLIIQTCTRNCQS